MNESFSPALLIRASAGSGKTYQLTSRILWLLLHGENPSKILATTFTRKAAGEIRARVMRRLARATIFDDERAALAADFGLAQLTQPRCEELLSNLLFQQHRLAICTLDALALKIVGLFFLELGLADKPLIVGTADYDTLVTEALGKMLSGYSSDMLDGLLALLQGGTPKRSVIRSLTHAVTTVHELFERCNDTTEWRVPEAADALDLDDTFFSSKLDEFMSCPLPHTKKGEPNKNWTKAVAAFAKHVTRHNYEAVWESAFAPSLWEGREYYREFAPEQLSSAGQELLHSLIRRLGSQIRNRTLATRELLSSFHSAMTSVRLRAGALRFQDVTRELARGRILERTEDLYFRLDGTYTHVLLDEFQDTSREQWDLLEPLIENILAGPSPERSFFCVGDAKQAIYGWRGGEASLFDYLESRFASVLDSRPLAVCRRCCPEILKFTDQLFLSLESSPVLETMRASAARWSTGYFSHESTVTTPGHVEIYEVHEEEDDVDLHQATARVAAVRAHALLTKYPELRIGILTRTNRGAAAVVCALRAPPFSLNPSDEAGRPLTSAPAVGAALSLLQFLTHPHDLLARYHLSTSPFGTLFDFTESRDEARALQLRQQLSATFRAEGPYRTFERLFHRVNESMSIEDREQVEAFLRTVREQALVATTSMSSLITALEAARNEGASPSPIRVMTVHKSKGLEFDAVILTELDSALVKDRSTLALLGKRAEHSTLYQSVSPSLKKELHTLFPELGLEELAALQRESSLSDSLSLLYVALTRARYTLQLLLPAAKERGAPEISFASLIRAGTPGIMPRTNSETPSACTLVYEQGDSTLPFNAATVSTSAVEKGAKKTSLHGPSIVPPIKRRKGLPFLRVADESPRSVAEALVRPSSVETQLELLVKNALATVSWRVAREVGSSGIADDFQSHSSLTKRAIQIAERFLDAADVAPFFSESCYPSLTTTVVTARPFCVRLGDKMVTGTFDRLLLFDRTDGELEAELISFMLRQGEVITPLELRKVREQAVLTAKACAKAFSIPTPRVRPVIAFLLDGTILDAGQ